METTQFVSQEPGAVPEPLPWQPQPPPTDLVFDDGKPLESNRHRIAMNVLIRSAQWGLLQRNRTDFFVGGNMFVYYSSRQVRHESYRGPDFFAALEVDGTRERQGWVLWEEEGHYPDVIIELLSATTTAEDKGPKKDIYERIFRTPDYFIFDPFDPLSLQGWRLNPGKGYEPLVPNEQGWLWSETLGFWVGLWEGVITREPATGTCAWLRFYDCEDRLVPLPEETAQQEAKQAQEHLEQEKQRAEQAQKQAEKERQRAEQAQEQVEQERQRAEQAQERAEQLAALLRARGIDSDNVQN